MKQALQPGASVARIAREHGPNANQVFAKRKLQFEGLLNASADASATMLPVTIVPRSVDDAASARCATVRFQADQLPHIARSIGRGGTVMCRPYPNGQDG